MNEKTTPLPCDNQESFWQAILLGEADRVAAALETRPDWAIAADKNGCTALMVAARTGSLEILNRLLPLSDARATEPQRGNSALTLAIDSIRADCVKALLPFSDANLSFLDSWGIRTTPLTEAAQSGSLAIVKLLAPVANDAWGSLQAAARNKNWECADYLADWAITDPCDLDDLEALEGIVALTLPGTMPKAEAMLQARDLATEVKNARSDADSSSEAEAGDENQKSGSGRRRPRSL